MCRPLAVLVLFALVPWWAGPAARAGDDPAAPAAETPRPHADGAVKEALKRFDEEFASDDMDTRLRILKWIGTYRHKSVLKRLKSLWLRNKDLEIQATAATGLGNQTAHPRKAALALIAGIEKYEKYATRNEPEGDDVLTQSLEATALANGLRALGRLPYKPDKKQWKMIRGLIDHNHDEIAIAMLDWCGATKEWRALPIILEWFNFYPDGYSWSGGSVSVDTGSAGNKDAKAAKAKFMAKYGGRAKKGRPKAHAAMRRALKEITGQDFTKPEELKAWMKENKQLLKKNGA